MRGVGGDQMIVLQAYRHVFLFLQLIQIVVCLLEVNRYLGLIFICRENETL